LGGWGVVGRVKGAGRWGDGKGRVVCAGGGGAAGEGGGGCAGGVVFGLGEAWLGAGCLRMWEQKVLALSVEGAGGGGGRVRVMCGGVDAAVLGRGGMGDVGKV